MYDHHAHKYFGVNVRAKAMNRVFLIELAILLVSTNISAQPSFNCGKNLTKVERVICENDNISSLDASLDYIYRVIMSGSSNTDTIRRRQKSWLEGLPQLPHKLYRYYEKRIDEFLSQPENFDRIIKSYFRDFESDMDKYVASNDYYSTMDQSIVPVLGAFILNAYLKAKP